MKKAIQSFVMVILLVLSLGRGAGAEYWERVAENGFGDSSNDYAWCMETFQDSLYVGTLNTLKGGEIWRSNSGNPDSWQKVYSSPTSVFGNAGVRCLYDDDGQAMYACTLNSLGAEILRTTDGERWSVVKKGIGRRWNTTFRCMTRFNDYLYVGAGGYKAQLYRSKNGLNWELVKTNPSFQSTRIYDPQAKIMTSNNTMIGELMVFKDQLYAFTWTKEARYRDLATHVFDYSVDRPTLNSNSPGAFEVWRSSDGVNWEKVVGKDDSYGNGMGFCLKDPEGLSNDEVTSTVVFEGKLYLGTQNSDGDCSIWRTSDGTQWTKVLDFHDLGESFNYYIWRMISFQDRLYIGVMNVGPMSEPGVTGAQVWASDSGNQGTFYNLVHNGFDGETWKDGSGREIPKNTGVRTFGVLHNTLYAGTAVIPSVLVPRSSGFNPRQALIAGRNIGCEIWRLIQ
ncbi:MAG: hypothetical protein AB1847_15940 [bacterium]